MEIEVFLFQLFIYNIFGALYYTLYKRLCSVEEKIVFFFFFVFYFIGGGVTWFGFPFKDILYPASGYEDLNLTLLHAIIYSKLVLLTPLVFIYILIKFRKRSSEKRSYYFSKIHKFSAILGIISIFTFLFFSVDKNLFNPSYENYTESISVRNSLNHSFMVTFLGKCLIYFLSIALISNELFNKKFVRSLILFIFILPFIVATDVLIFLSKLNLSYYLLTYIFLFLIFNKFNIFTLFILGIVPILYILYNLVSPSGYVPEYIFEPLIKAITRFTAAILYFIDYYVANDFMMKPYFSSVFGVITENPNITVYSHMFGQTGGSLASGIIIYNYANLGPLSVFVTIIEYSLLFLLFNFIKFSISPPFRISLITLLAFGILNYSFTTILLNPLVCFIAFILYYFVRKILNLTFKNRYAS